MIFTYTPSGQKRLALPEWFCLEKWPHPSPVDRHHKHFIIVKSGIEYRCGPAIQLPAAQVSALIFTAKPMQKGG